MKWGGGPDTIYSAGRDTSPWLPNGFLHFTQLFPLRKSYQYRLRGPEKPTTHTRSASTKHLRMIRFAFLFCDICDLVSTTAIKRWIVPTKKKKKERRGSDVSLSRPGQAPHQCWWCWEGLTALGLGSMHMSRRYVWDQQKPSP